MGGQLWAVFMLNMIDNPKIIGLSDTAFRAFIESVMYSRQHLTDGFLDVRVVRRKWPMAADELTSNDPDNPSWIEVDGGFQIYNFCEYQTTTEEIKEMKAQKSRAGKASAEKRRKQKLNDEATQAQQGVEDVLNTNATQCQPESESESETETDKGLVVKSTRKTELQPDWKPSPAGYEYAKTRAPGMNPDIQAEKFVNYNLSQGRKLGDWEAAWRNWVLKAIEFDPLLAQPLPPPKRQFTGKDYDDEF